MARRRAARQPPRAGTSSAPAAALNRRRACAAGWSDLPTSVLPTRVRLPELSEAHPPMAVWLTLTIQSHGGQMGSHLQSRPDNIRGAIVELAFPFEMRHDAAVAMPTYVRDPIADPALLTHWLVLGSLTLPGEPQHVRSARTFVAHAIGARHARADEALLLTSELVTNAVTHTRSRLPGGTVTVVVSEKAWTLLISVTDDGSESTVPAIRTAEGGEHGNGLLLAATIADIWGYVQHASRTTVWVKLGAQSPRGPEIRAGPKEWSEQPRPDCAGSSDLRPGPALAGRPAG